MRHGHAVLGEIAVPGGLANSSVCLLLSATVAGEWEGVGAREGLYGPGARYQSRLAHAFCKAPACMGLCTLLIVGLDGGMGC
jgi:hypothetical protein